MSLTLRSTRQFYTPVVTVFFYQLRDFIRTALHVSIQHTTPAKGNKKAIAEEHFKVYNAIASGDPERAKNMMTYMIDEAMAFIEKEIADKEAAQ